MGKAITGDGEGTEVEKERDRPPPNVRSPNFSAVVAPMVRMSSLSRARVACMECNDAAYCCICSPVCVSVCLLVTTVNCAKMAEPIEMPFGVWIRRAYREPCLRRGPYRREKWAILGLAYSDPI